MMGASNQSMREQLEEAFDEDQTEDEETGGTEEAGGSAEDTTEPLGDSTEEPAGGEDAEEGAGDDSEGGDDTEGDKDDDAAASDDKVGSTKVEDSGDTKGSVKAPSSWKPGAREEWGKVPIAAQKEISRREKHMDNMLRESADSRKFQSGFNEMMHPFGPLMAAQNATPMESVKSLMTTAAGLTLGTPSQKAQIVSNIMNQYGVDVVELDSILVGKGPGTQQPGGDFQAALHQQLAPIRQFMGDMNNQRQTYESGQQATMEEEITTFAQNPKNEFFEDVRQDMADLMEMASKRNAAMTIQQAYDKACRMDPDIGAIVGKREAAAAAAENNTTIGKKRHAASSIHGAANSGGDSNKSSSIRGALTDAWDDAV